MIACCSQTATAQAPVADAAAQALAQALQRKYDGIHDFSADFVHTYRGGVLKKEAVERGRLLVKKPGKMRWEYTSPEEKLFVSDGVKMYSYIPQDKQVLVQSIPQNDQVSMPTMFLSGKGSLSRDFTPSMAEPSAGAPPGTLALKLVPKSSPAGLRLADPRGRAGDAGTARSGHRRRPGRPIELFLYEPEGKSRNSR